MYRLRRAHSEVAELLVGELAVGLASDVTYCIHPRPSEFDEVSAIEPCLPEATSAACPGQPQHRLVGTESSPLFPLGLVRVPYPHPQGRGWRSECRFICPQDMKHTGEHMLDPFLLGSRGLVPTPTESHQRHEPFRGGSRGGSPDGRFHVRWE